MNAAEFFSLGWGHLLRRGYDARRALGWYNREERAVLEYRDTHPGETCFIIGNGLSLRFEDLESVQAAGYTCFASNKIYRLYPKTKWRPDYYACIDTLVFEQNYGEILDSTRCPVFLRRDMLPEVRAYERETGRTVDRARFITYGWRHSGRTVFYPQAANVLSGGTVTFTLMELAWMMGFRRMYLLGCDHTYASFEGLRPGTHFSTSEEINGNYFSDDYLRSGELISVGNPRLVEEGYRLARDYAEEHGGEIINATRGGKLEIFKRTDMDALLEQIKCKDGK